VLEIALACRLDVLQFHGAESPDYCRGWQQRVVKGFCLRGLSALEQLDRYEVDAYLVDAFVPGLAGGTGQCCDWDLAYRAAVPGAVGGQVPCPEGARRRIILAGGITPENVAQAILRARPYAVDVSSGVETAGVKDPEKIRELLKRARRINDELEQSGDT
jgi:phosphoribosylanthranilate isomerase